MQLREKKRDLTERSTCIISLIVIGTLRPAHSGRKERQTSSRIEDIPNTKLQDNGLLTTSEREKKIAHPYFRQ